MSSLENNPNDANNPNDPDNENMSDDSLDPVRHTVVNIDCPNYQYNIFHFVAFFSDRLDPCLKEPFLRHVKDCKPCRNFSIEAQKALAGITTLDRYEQLQFLCFLMSPLWQELEKPNLVDKVKEELNDDLKAIDFMLDKIKSDTDRYSN